MHLADEEVKQPRKHVKGGSLHGPFVKPTVLRHLLEGQLDADRDLLITHSAALNAVASASAWSLTSDVLRALRQDGVALDQRLAAHFMTCFGRLGDVASAEAIFKVRVRISSVE